jgi:hypothetical protein
MWKQRTILWLAVAVASNAAVGCKNPRYCPGNPNDDCQQDAGGCADDHGCTAPAVCDISGSHMCVQCTLVEAAACVGTTPVCVGTQCQGCTAHAQCITSNACLPDGSCADPGQVAYVSEMGTDNAECSLTMPCTKLTAALATMRPYVKLHGMLSDMVSIVDRNVTILADPGAKLMPSTIGLLLEVKGSSHASISDLEVTGAGTTSGFGISLPAGNTATLELRHTKITSNTAGGISMAGGTLTISQSIISNNPGGGIAISGGTFAIVGNVFLGNGSSISTTGGVSISTTQSAANRLEFNSFNQNASQNGIGAAVDCKAGMFMARNNILSGNGTLMNMEQVGGTCSHAYSIVQPGTVPTGPGNTAADPRFASPASGDLHLKPMSPAIGAADPASDLTGLAARDIDGDLRAKPADIGAYAFHASGGQ